MTYDPRRYTGRISRLHPEMQEIRSRVHRRDRPAPDPVVADYSRLEQLMLQSLHARRETQIEMLCWVAVARALGVDVTVER